MPLMAWGDELGIRAKLRFLPALVASWGHLGEAVVLVAMRGYKHTTS